MISIDEFEKIYNLIPGEPEFELWFDEDGPSYMIIKYADCATFQRCGNRASRQWRVRIPKPGRTS